MKRFILFAALFLGLVGFVLAAKDALSHNGRLAKDGCHNDRAAGERHWHRDGTQDRGGECVGKPGVKTRVICESVLVDEAALLVTCVVKEVK